MRFKHHIEEGSPDFYSHYDYSARLRRLLFSLHHPFPAAPADAEAAHADFDGRFDAFAADPANACLEIDVNDHQLVDDLLVIVLAYEPESRAPLVERAA